MTPKEIQQLRVLLGETVEDFGRRFHRSGRTVENWEQGRHEPDVLVVEMLKKLKKRREGT